MGKKIHACPVCGRFISEKQLSKYRGIESGNQALKDYSASLLADLKQRGKTLSEKDETLGTLRKTVSDQAKHIAYLTAELGDIKATLSLRDKEIERIYARNWWERLLNMIPE